MTLEVNQAGTKYTRRSLLSAACATTLAVGCDRKSASVPEEATSRTDVPIRVLWAGSEEDVETVTRAWGAVSPQPLKLEVMPLDRANPAGLLKSFAERAKKNDVVVVPLFAMAQLQAGEAIIPISQQEMDSTDERIGRLYPVLRNGAAKYAGEFYSTPIGAKVPALLSVEAVDQLETWGDYQRWVKEDLNGAASEPLSAGWAAASFLTRASLTVDTGWLFDRESAKPLVDREEYVATLAQLRETAKVYSSGRQSPAEIWTRLQSGELMGGIGFQAGREDESVEVTVSDLPQDSTQNRVLLDAFSPVVAISSVCRQSAASKELMTWLSGGDGSESIRREVSGMSVARVANVDSAQSVQRSRGGYTRWLRQRLSKSNLPTIQLISADDYYAVLDQSVGDCLDGKLSPSEALAGVAKEWETLTSQVGREEQVRAWRKANGLRA